MGLRRILKITFLCAAALIAAGSIALWVFLDKEATGPELKPRIEAAASEFLGRPVTIDKVEWRRWPSAMLVGTNVRLYDDTLKTTLLVDAPVVEAPIALLSFFKLAAGITELRILSPKISLRRGKDGVWNAERLVDEISARPDEPDRKWGTLAFNWFSVAGGTVTVEDAAGDLASLSPIDVTGRGKLRFGRHHVHFPFDLAALSESTTALINITGDLGGHLQLKIDVKNAEPSLARLAWPPAAKWTGRCEGTFYYDERKPAPWRMIVSAAPLFISTSMPTFDSLEGSAEYFSPSSATFSVSARRAGTQLEAKGATDNGALSRLNVDVKNGEASLAGLAWPPAAQWTGRWEGSVAFDERPPVRWRIHLRASALAVSTSAPKLDLLEANGDYLSSSSSTFSGVARSSTTEIQVKGSAIGDALKLDVTSPRTDLETVLAFGSFAASAVKRSKRPKKTGSTWPKRLSARVSAADLRYGTAQLRNMSAVVRRTNGPYTLERLSFETLGGSITASGSYTPSTSDDALKLNWKTSGVDIQDLFHALGSTRDAGGFADSEGRLVTGLGDRFFPAMSGTVKLDIKNGWTAMPGLLKVLSRLNLSTLFSEALGHHRQRLPYDEAHASVTIVKGKVTTDKPIMLQNKTFQMAFLGSYDLPSRTVDGKIVVNFLTVTDEIIKLIPGVRDILLGKEKGLMPIWVEVKGRGDDPQIKVLSARTISGPVWNTFKHILRLPKTLFEEIKPPKDSAQP